MLDVTFPLRNSGSGRSLRSRFVCLASVRDCSARRQFMNFHRIGLKQDIIELNPLCHPSDMFVNLGISIWEASYWFHIAGAKLGF